MEKVLQFLRENTICSLATCNDGKPRSSTMEYAVLGDNVFFATDGNSIKASNIKANNKISLSAHNMPKFVTIDGITATPSNDEIDQYKKVISKRHPEFKEMLDKGNMNTFIYFKFIPEVAYYNDYSTGMTPAEVIKL